MQRMNKAVAMGLLAALGAGVAALVVAAPANAYNQCGTWGRIDYSVDRGYILTTGSCEYSSLKYQYQPPTSGTYYKYAEIDYGVYGTVVNAGRYAEAVQAWACSAYQDYRCTLGPAWTFTSYKTFP